MFGFDFQLRFAGFANPVVLSFDEGVIVDPLAVIRNTDVTLHGWTPSGR
jgi:hypothetical protein